MSFFFLQPQDAFLVKRYVWPGGNKSEFLLIKSHVYGFSFPLQRSAILEWSAFWWLVASPSLSSFSIRIILFRSIIIFDRFRFPADFYTRVYERQWTLCHGRSQATWIYVLWTVGVDTDVICSFENLPYRLAASWSSSRNPFDCVTSLREDGVIAITLEAKNPWCKNFMFVCIMRMACCR